MDVLPLGLTGDGALRAAAVADREVTRMEGVRLDHLVAYLGQVSAEWEPPAWQGRGAERAIRLGGPGTPEVPEFAVVEVAATLGLTQPAATVLCADVLDLAYRLPRLTAAVRAGVLGFVRARTIARRIRELSKEQAALVEERLCQPRDTSLGPAPLVAVVAMSRLRTVVDQAVITVRGPESEAEAERRVAASLFVQVSPAEPGAADVAARLDVTDAVRLDQRLHQIAGWLAQVGDSRPKAILRAVALGLLADPALLRALDDLRKQHRDASASGAGPGSGTGLSDPALPHPALPDTVPPDTSVPGTPAPDTSVPGTPAPDTPAPGTSVPGAPASGTSVPDAVVPGTSMPDAVMSDTAGSDAAAPDGVGSGRRAEAEDRLQPTLMEASELEGSDATRPDHSSPALQESVTHEDSEPPEQVIERGASGAPVVIDKPLAGVAGCPPGLLEKFAGLTSTVLYLHLDQASGSWCEERGGVLTARQARAVVGHGRVSVRPVLDLAEPLSYTGYVAPPRLKEQLALLNAGYCPFPYCHRRARAGDVDHQVPYAKDGPTASWNTHRPCPKHHRAKDKGGWQVTTPTPGVWIWTSPAGAVYLVTNGVTTQLNGIGARGSAAGARPDADTGTRAGAGAVVGGAAIPVPDRQADTRTGTRGWTPSWDPWEDIDPLTLDEHDVTYGFIDTA